jgi:hypothetical protein
LSGAVASRAKRTSCGLERKAVALRTVNAKTKTPQPAKSSRECKQIAFDHQKSLDLHIDLPVVAIVAASLPVPVFEPFPQAAGLHIVESSPPDLQVLHSTFLI